MVLGRGFRVWGSGCRVRGADEDFGSYFVGFRSQCYGFSMVRVGGHGVMV